MAVQPFDRSRYTISQAFGVRNSAYRLGYHAGVDYRTPTGVAVRAPEAGFVSYFWSNSYGNVAALVRPNGDVIWFAHNSRRGNTGHVSKGTIIAYTGNTGWSTGPHSHVEYRLGGSQNRPIDFEAWLRNNPEPRKFPLPKVGERIRLVRGVNRTVFRAGTTNPVGTIRPTDDTFYYLVRGVDSRYPNRILINSASAGGNGVALALYYTNGQKIEGWVKA
jgi:hypothetical protein